MLGAPILHAETLYVIEQVVVNVNSAPDATGTRVATIKSGDTVEVLERQGDQIHVHLANGTEGWVRKSYLSEKEGLQHQLNERNAEVEKLKQDVARLQSDVAAAKAGPAPMTPPAQAHGKTAPTTAAQSATPPTAAPAADPAQPGDEPNTTADAAHEPPYFMTPPEAPARPVWHWALGSFVVALGLGFVLGWQMLDRRIRRKYGGLRIY
jgi:hypothetical protein